MQRAAKWNHALASLGAAIVANAVVESATEVMGSFAEVGT
jgi:hypothetical protein